MKKFLFLSSIAALTLASCSDDFAPGNNLNPQIEGKSVAYVTFPINTDDNTRTVLDGQQVNFEIGDEIGLFSASTNSGVKNAPFVYKYNKEGAEAFVGQIYLTPETDYYAYYPYSQTQTLNENNELTFVINPEQSLNEIQCTGIPVADYKWSSNIYEGSFSNSTVPAYAVAEATSTTDISFTLNGLASYIVIPVSGYTQTPIQQVTLSLYSSSTQQKIAGSFNVNPATFEYETGSTTPIGTLTPLASDTENQGKVITLNCGSGLTLKLGEIVNLWFVVPAGITFDSATLTFVDDVEGGQHEIERPLSKPFTTKLNAPGRLAYASQTPFEYYQGGVVPVTNALQFLEYAYLATTGVDNIATNWNKIPEGKFTSPSGISFTSLRQMLTGEGVTFGGTSTQPTVTITDASQVTLNPIVIMNNIEIDQKTVQNLLGWSGGSNNFWEELPDYYQDVYGNVIENKPINAIGGTMAFKITGNNIGTETNPMYPVIGGSAQNGSFLVEGNSLIASTNTYKATVSNLGFDYVSLNTPTANADEETLYYFLVRSLVSSANSTQSNYVGSFSGLSFGANCSITNSEADDEVSVDQCAVVNSVSSSWFNSVGYGDQPGQSLEKLPFSVNNGFKFANTLGANLSFNFTGVLKVNSFNNINVNASDVVFTIPAPAEVDPQSSTTNLTGVAAAAYLVKNAQLNTQQNVKGYSILDNAKTTQTSYWSGYAFENATLGSAEALAYLVQTSLDGNQPFDMLYNLNLMGQVELEGDEEPLISTWWTTQKSNNNKAVIVNAGTNANSIQNVYIAPVNGKSTNTLTLLGWNGAITGGVEISGIEIDNSGENALKNSPAIAAIAAILPSNQVNKCKVTGYTVTTDYGYNTEVSAVKNNVVGGLFVVLFDSNYKNTEGSSLAGNFTGLGEGVVGGSIAGWISYSMSTEAIQTITNEWEGVTNPFGEFVVQAAATNINGGKLYFEGFASGFTTSSINVVAGPTVKDGYTLQIFEGTGNTAKPTITYFYNNEIWDTTEY